MYIVAYKFKTDPLSMHIDDPELNTRSFTFDSVPCVCELYISTSLLAISRRRRMSETGTNIYLVQPQIFICLISNAGPDICPLQINST